MSLLANLTTKVQKTYEMIAQLDPCLFFLTSCGQTAHCFGKQKGPTLKAVELTYLLSHSFNIIESIRNIERFLFIDRMHLREDVIYRSIVVSLFGNMIGRDETYSW